MLSRLFAAWAVTLTCAHGQPTQTDDDWLQGIPALKSSDSKSFQLRALIGADKEQITADLSYARPERQCLILRDSFDGLPLMIAADGMVWLYDPLGGQILQIRALPEFLLERYAGSIRSRWGMRADFPDYNSQITFRLDFGSVMRGFAGDEPKFLTIDRASRTATYMSEKFKARLTIDKNDPPRPVSFSFESSDGKRDTTVSYHSFVYGAPLPKWHRELNSPALAKHVRVRAVRDRALFPPEVQEKMGKIIELLQGGGVFILRPMLRDAELRSAFARNSPVTVDFDMMKANDEAMRGPWLEALREQGLAYPAAQWKNASP